MSFFISEAMAEGAPAPAAPPEVGFLGSPLVMLVIMMVFFYFFIIRPQSKRNKEHKELMNGLSKGDEVALASGMLGTITKVSEEYVVVQVADNTEISFRKNAVTNTLPKGTIKSI